MEEYNLSDCFRPIRRQDIVSENIRPTHYLYVNVGQGRRSKCYHYLLPGLEEFFEKYYNNDASSINLIKMSEKEIDDLMKRLIRINSIKDEFAPINSSTEDIEEPSKDEYKNSTSDTEEERTESGSTVSRSSASGDMIFYPKIIREKQIIESKFISDPKYTIFNFFEDIINISDINELLILMKKCLIFVMVDTNTKPAWYAWYGDRIDKITITKNGYRTKVRDCDYEGIRHRFVKLYDICCDFNVKYGFNIREKKDLLLIRDTVLPTVDTKIGPEIKSDVNGIVLGSSIIKTIYIGDDHISHFFICDKFSTGLYDHIKCCKKLYIEYTQWKKDKISDVNINADFKIKIQKDDVKSSKGFTEKFKTKNLSDNDKFYRVLTSGSRWIIKKK